MITAKIQCNLKQEYSYQSDGVEIRYAVLGFIVDYADGRNQEWAEKTPALDLRMTVKGDVATMFEPGKRYTLTFAEDE